MITQLMANIRRLQDRSSVSFDCFKQLARALRPDRSRSWIDRTSAQSAAKLVLESDGTAWLAL